MTKKIEVFASEALPGELEEFPDIKRGWGTTKELTGGIPPMKWFNAIQKRTDESINAISDTSVGGYTFKNGATLESENDFIYDDTSKTWYFWTGEYPKIVPPGEKPIGKKWIPLSYSGVNVIDSIEELKVKDVSIGDIFLVNGYYNKGDMDSSLFVIESNFSSGSDLRDSIHLDNGLYANRVIIDHSVVSIREYGAKEDDPESFNKAIIDAINKNTSSYATIIIPSGEWNVGKLLCKVNRSNVKIIGEHNSVIKVSDRLIFGLYPDEDEDKEKFIIDNLVITGVSDGSFFTIDASQVNGVTVKNCKFLNIGGHYIDSCGSYNLVIDNVEIVGSRLNGSTRDYIESFQLSKGDPVGQTWRNPEHDEFMRGEPTKSVTVRGLTVKPFVSGDDVIYAQRPIGGHDNTKYDSVVDVTIEDCFISGLMPYEDTSDRLNKVSAINFRVSGCICIKNNTYLGLGSVGLKSRPFLTITVGESIDKHDINISNNKLNNLGGVDNDSEILIKGISNESQNKVSVNISDNFVEFNSNLANQNVVQVDMNDKSECSIKIADNKVINCRFLSYLTNISIAYLEGNVIKGSSRAIVYADNKTVNDGLFFINSNKIINGGFINISGYKHTLISNNYWNGTNEQAGLFNRININDSYLDATGNIISNVPGDESMYGVYKGTEKVKTENYELKIKVVN